MALPSIPSRNVLIFLSILRIIIEYGEAIEIPVPFGCGLYDWSKHQSQFTYKCSCPAIRFFQFPELPPEYTYGLVFTCGSDVFTDQLKTGDLNHLRNLQALQFIDCNFEGFDSGAFSGLQSLTDIEIKSTSFTQSNKTIPDGLFDSTPQLRTASFQNTNIYNISEKVFCKTEMAMLELIGNRVKTLDGIGCGFNNTCCQGLKIISVVDGDLKEIRAKDLQNVPMLLELQVNGNRIGFVEDGAFDSLESLNTVGLFGNELKSLPPNLFRHNPGIIALDLGSNQVTQLDPGMFKGLFLLQGLNLEHNRFTNFSSGLFRDLSDLLELYLKGNQIRKLPEDGLFKTLSSLKNLSIADNLLTNIGDNELQGLKSLQLLNLSGNELGLLADRALSHFPLLTTLDLSHNNLTSVPNIASPELTLLDLAFNHIEVLGNDSLEGLRKLVGLRISFNQLRSLSPIPFRDLSSLMILNLQSNSIDKIERGTFQVLTNLKHLVLGNNRIKSLANNFIDLPITFLNLSNNFLSEFDFTLIPTSLLDIDISGNRISNIVDPFGDQFVLELQRFVANDNRLTELNGHFFPRKLQILEVARNNISHVQHLTNPPFPFLFRVDLKTNQIAEIKMMDITFIYPGIPKDQPMLEVDLMENPLSCSCENVWLKLSRSAMSRTYPQFFWHLTCYRNTKRHKQFGYTFDVDHLVENDFLCPFTDVNGAVCPPKCTCFHTKNRIIFVIDCGDVTWNRTDSPKLPPKTSTLFLDNNEDLSAAVPQLLADLDNLKILYVNGSSLMVIPDKMLDGTPNLTELYLQENTLTDITARDLLPVPNLKRLHLHNNKLEFLSNGTFSGLTNLIELTLHKNRLFQPKLWELMPSSGSLSSLTLSRNPINCDCQFVLPLLEWFNEYSRTRVNDLDEVYCDEVWTRPVLQFDSSSCISAPGSGLILPIVSVISVFVFLIVVSILTFLYRLELQVWLYSRYGVRIFNSDSKSDVGKVYDSFVSYANPNEEWIANELVPKLEGYKLCLHQRDFLVGAYIGDSIVDAVEKSCRTLVVLTPSYVESEWCQFEFKSAHLQSLKDRCTRIIVLVLQDVDLHSLDKQLRAYIKTNTYLRVDDKLFWKKLKFALPDVKL